MFVGYVLINMSTVLPGGGEELKRASLTSIITPMAMGWTFGQWRSPAFSGPLLLGLGGAVVLRWTTRLPRMTTTTMTMTGVRQ